MSTDQISSTKVPAEIMEYSTVMSDLSVVAARFVCPEFPTVVEQGDFASIEIKKDIVTLTVCLLKRNYLAYS